MNATLTPSHTITERRFVRPKDLQPGDRIRFHRLLPVEIVATVVSDGDKVRVTYESTGSDVSLIDQSLEIQRPLVAREGLQQFICARDLQVGDQINFGPTEPNVAPVDVITYDGDIVSISYEDGSGTELDRYQMIMVYRP